MMNRLQNKLITMVTAVLLSNACMGLLYAQNRAPWVGLDLNGVQCSGRDTKTGPYDYRDRYKLYKQLHMVERRHFTRRVEDLIGGESTSDIRADLNYTLTQWPNHHRALHSIIQYQFRPVSKKHRFKKSIPAECYLQRAAAFTPSDATVYMLYGLYLHKAKHFEEALDKYKKAEEISPGYKQNQYNMGLLLVDLKRYPEARAYAEKLYSNGFPLAGLKNKLIKARHWPDE